MLGRIVRGSALGCTVVLAALAPALAGNRNVPGSYSTIQAGVDAAAEGDVVVCAAGTYTEAVAATKSKITIQGASGAVWDGGTGTSARDCLVVTGNAVVVTGFAFKNGKSHCKLTGDDCKVTNCTGADASESFCVIAGARGDIESCRADRCKGPSIKCVGDSPKVKYCNVYDCDDVGFHCEGDHHVARSCWAERCKKGGYRCKGREHDVQHCDARTCDEFGFSFEGDLAYCYDNYAKECGTSAGTGSGYIVVGSSNYFEYCDAYKCKPCGHWWKGNTNQGYDNWCDYDEEDGFRREGDDNECDYEQARYCGNHGFRCEGNRNAHNHCDSYSHDRDGFNCKSGQDNSYRSCRGKYNSGAGCRNSGTSTDVSYCTFLYNSVDIGLGTSGATWGTFSLNTFVSGSLTGILGLGLGL